MRSLLMFAALLAACDEASTTLDPPAEPTSVAFTAAPDVQPFVDRATADVPLGDAPDALRVTVERDDRCAECYRIERDGPGYVIRGGGPLGIQYGVTELLEGLGYRFYHPFAMHVPERMRTAGIPVDRDFAPEVPLRALHLHTLHPIEPTWAFWTPGDESLDEARHILDWVVRSRANAIQWVALEDILKDDATYAAWKAHTRKLLDAAHARGLTVGLGIQLFGQSNLQRAFDLVDGDFDEAEVRERLRRITEDLPFDRYNLSFGEFVGADPQKFVDTLNRAYALLHAMAPHAEIPATIHVGNYDSLRVEYQGQRLLYYFLVQFADPAIIPWIHTVMYYDLYEDAGGAYAHDRFDEHRAFLEDRLQKGAPVGYFPEDAYWVAFDDSVPTFLPLYVRSRHLDLARLRDAGRLPAHVLFSSGWEWGYWLNDYAALRMGYTLPAKWTDVLAAAFAPYDADVAGAVAALADVEHDALIDGRLAPYLAGRDTIIDAGDKAGVIAAPDRLQPTEAAALDGDAARAFAADVVAPLSKLAADLRAAADRLKALPVTGDAFVDELRDGAEVTALRAAYVAAIYRAATGAPEALDEADDLLAAARAVVARRHAHLHAPHPERLTKRVHNPTLYQFGYLFWADSLCYWERERVETARLLGLTGAVIPACAF